MSPEIALATSESVVHQYEPIVFVGGIAQEYIPQEFETTCQIDLVDSSLEEECQRLLSDVEWVLHDLSKDPLFEPFALANTGFNLRKQLYLLVQAWEEFSDGRPEAKAREAFLQKTRFDGGAFDQEYIKQQNPLHIPVTLSEDKNIVCPRYDMRPFREIISFEERNGSVYKTVLKLEEQLKNALPGSLFVYTSPPGWSGMGVDHPESQTYIYRIDGGGNLEAITLRSNLSIGQTEEFLALLGERHTEYGNLPERERIQAIVKTLANPARSSTKTFEDIVLLMSKALGNEKQDKGFVIFSNKHTTVTLDDLLKRLENRDLYFAQDRKTQRILDRYAKFIESEVTLDNLTRQTLRDVAIETGRAIVDMEKSPEEVDFNAVRLTKSKAEQEIESNKKAASSIAEKEGCAGGGVRKRNGKSGENGELLCPRCGVGTLKYIGPGWYTCASCGYSAYLNLC